MDHLQSVLSALLMGAGLIVLCLGVLGTWRFRYCLNRMHASAVNDTLGLLLMLSGLATARGLAPVTLKYLLILVLLWIASPLSSHLIALLEIRSAPDRLKHMEDRHLTDPCGKEAD